MNTQPATDGASPPAVLDIDHLRGWIGRTQTDHDVAALRHARLMAATVDRPGPALADGDPLPPLWHWLYFLQARPPGELGRDGHPARGGFLPPVPLPNRMWAGGEIRWLAPVPLGAAVELRSTVQAVQAKPGRHGPLVFVAVRHALWCGGALAVDERQDLVYKDATPPGAGSAAADQPLATHRRTWTPDSTQLFRYSALTFNGHRIHYDADYCRAVEGYAGLVVHGPLVATQLADLATEALGAAPARFRYRGLSPTIAGTPITLAAALQGDGVELWAERPDGTVGMQAWAQREGTAP